MRTLIAFAVLGSLMAQAAHAVPLRKMEKADFATELFRKIQLYGG